MKEISIVISTLMCHKAKRETLHAVQSSKKYLKLKILY